MKDKQSVIGKLLKAFAMDAEPDEMVEAVNTLKDRCAKDESPEEQEMENAIFKELKEKIDRIEDRINGLEARKDDVKDEEGDEPEMNELEKLEKEVADEEVDKRDIIRQIMAIAGKNEDNEDVRTIAKLAKKLAYDNSEAGVHDDDFANDPKIIEAYAEKAQDEAPEEKTNEELKKEVADAKQVIAGIQDSAVRRQVADSFAKIIRGKMQSGEAYKKALYASQEHVQDSSKVVDVNAAFKKIREDRFRK